jgi:hypothetical protein
MPVTMPRVRNSCPASLLFLRVLAASATTLILEAHVLLPRSSPTLPFSTSEVKYYFDEVMLLAKLARLVTMPAPYAFSKAGQLPEDMPKCIESSSNRLKLLLS